MSVLKKRIVIIEDHPMVRDHLTLLFNKEPDMEVCGQADDAAGGVALLKRVQADLAIVDITLKESSGLEFIKQLRSLSIQTPVLVLSMHEESVYAQRALRAGAGGYITKNSPSDGVLLAARDVLAGKVYLSPSMTAEVLQTLSTGRSTSALTRSVSQLSDREIAVLEMIGRGSNSRAIADTLGVGVPTVDTYRARIKEKMNLQNGFELVHFAIQWVNGREETR